MSEIHGAVGSYVLHALDDHELHDVEAHLEVCETCRREVLEFAETAAQLSSLVQTAPPPELKGSILAAIQQVRPLPPETPEVEVAYAPRRAALAVVPERDPAPVEARPVVDELTQRRQQRARRLLALATAAAVVVALALGGVAANLARERQAQVAEAALESQLLTAPDAKTYATTMRDGTRVSFIASKSMNKALFVGNNLPMAGAEQSYQLWTLNAKGSVPDAVFSGEGRRAWFTGDIRAANGLALTIEPEGGSRVPTEPIQALTNL